MSNQMQYYRPSSGREGDTQNNYPRQQQSYDDPRQYSPHQENQQWGQGGGYSNPQYRENNNYDDRNRQPNYNNDQNFQSNYDSRQNQPNYDNRYNDQPSYDNRQNNDLRSNADYNRGNQNNRDIQEVRHQGPDNNYREQPRDNRSNNYEDSRNRSPERPYNNNTDSYSNSKQYNNNNYNNNDNNYSYERDRQPNDRNSYSFQQTNQQEQYAPAEPIVKRPQILAQTTRNVDGGAAVFGVVAKVDPPVNSPQSPNRPHSHPQQDPYYNALQPPPQHDNNRSNYLTPIIEQPTPPASPRFNEPNNYNNNIRDVNYKNNNYSSNQSQYNPRPQQFDPNYDPRLHDQDRPIDDSSGYGSTHTERSNEGQQQFYNNSRDYDPKFSNNASKPPPIQVQRPLPINARSQQGGPRSPPDVQRSYESQRSPPWQQGSNREPPQSNYDQNRNQDYNQHDNRDNRRPVRHWTLKKDDEQGQGYQQQNDGVDRTQIKGVKNVKNMFEKPGAPAPLPQPSAAWGGNQYNNNSRPVPPRPRIDPPPSQSYGNSSFSPNGPFNNPLKQYGDQQYGKSNFEPQRQYNNQQNNNRYPQKPNYDPPPNRDETPQQRQQPHDPRFQSDPSLPQRFQPQSNLPPKPQNFPSPSAYGPPIQANRHYEPRSPQDQRSPPLQSGFQSRQEPGSFDPLPVDRRSRSPEGHRSFESRQQNQVQFEPRQNNRNSRSPEGRRPINPREQDQGAFEPRSPQEQRSFQRPEDPRSRSPQNERSFVSRSQGQEKHDPRPLGYNEPPAQHSQSMGNLTRVTSPGNSQRNSYSGDTPMVVGVRFKQEDPKPEIRNNNTSSDQHSNPQQQPVNRQPVNQQPVNRQPDNRQSYQQQQDSQPPYQQKQQQRPTNRDFEPNQHPQQHLPGTERRPVSFVSDQQSQDDYVPDVVKNSYRKFSQSDTDLRSDQQPRQNNQTNQQPNQQFDNRRQQHGKHNQHNDNTNQQFNNRNRQNYNENEPNNYQVNQNKPFQQNQPVLHQNQRNSINNEEDWPTPPSSMVNHNQQDQDYQQPNRNYGPNRHQQPAQFEPKNQTNIVPHQTNQKVAPTKPRPVYYQNKPNNNHNNQIFYSNQPHPDSQLTKSKYTTRQPPSGSDQGTSPQAGGSRSHPRHPFDPIEDDDSSEGIDVDAPTPPPQQKGWRHSGKWEDQIGGSPINEGQRPVPAGEKFQKEHKYERQPGDGLNDDWNYNQQNYNNAKPIAPRKPNRSSLKQSPEKTSPPDLRVEPATPVTPTNPSAWDNNDEHKLSHAYSKDRLRVVKNMSRKPPSRQGSSSTLVADVSQEDEENYEITVTTNDLNHTSISSCSNISVQQQQQPVKHKHVQPPSQKVTHKKNYNPEPQVPISNNTKSQHDKPPPPIEKQKPSKIVFKKPSSEVLKPVLSDVQEPVSEKNRRPPTYTGFGYSPEKPKSSLGSDLLGQFKHAQESAIRSAAKKQDKALKSIQAITRMKRTTSPTKKPKETVADKNVNKIMQNRDDHHDVYNKNKPRSAHRGSPDDRSTSVRSSSTATGRREDSGSDEESFRRGRTNQSRRDRGNSQGNSRNPRGRSRSRDRITSPSRGRSSSRDRIMSPERRVRERSRERDLDRGGHARKSERYHEPVSPYRGERGSSKSGPNYPRGHHRSDEPEWVGKYRQRRPPGDSPPQRRAWVNDPRWKPKKEFDIEEYERDVRKATSYNSDFEQPSRPRQQMIPNKLLMGKGHPPKGGPRNDDWMRNLKEHNKKANRNRFGNTGLK